MLNSATRRKTMTVEEILTIEVKPGWKKGTKITFPEKGNEQPNIILCSCCFGGGGALDPAAPLSLGGGGGGGMAVGSGSEPCCPQQHNRRVFDLACFDNRGTPEKPAQTCTLETKESQLCVGTSTNQPPPPEII